MRVGLSRVHFPVRTLGPGARVGIWFQGCSIRCPGCVSIDTWKPALQPVSVEQLLTSITPWMDACDGVTLSGGEPFDQVKSLSTILELISSGWPDKDVLVYSGYSFETIQPDLTRLAGTIDVLISDPLDSTFPQTLPLRGSDNQRMHFLTARGREKFARFTRPSEERRLDVMFDRDGTAWMAGVPRREDLLRLRDLLRAEGHQATVTELEARQA